MPKDKSKHTYEDREPSTLFREFAAECAQLAKTAPTPDKRALYLRMASVWHQMAQRWEKKSSPGMVGS
jgi:acid phosphatase class B